MHGSMHTQSRPEAPNSIRPGRALSPVTDFPPKRFGIRDTGGALKEWGLWVARPASRDAMIDVDYAVLPEGVVRQPWEAFERVGFRCVRDVNSNLN